MNRMMRTAAAAALMLAAAGGALAQAWPAKPVKVVIPIPAGGPADALMRAIAPELSAIWKHPVVIQSDAWVGQPKAKLIRFFGRFLGVGSDASLLISRSLST